MKLSLVSFLLCQDAVGAFLPSFLANNPSGVIQKKARTTTFLSMSTGGDDTYDDWYADFDPSQFESSDHGAGSSSSGADHDYTRDPVDNSNVDLDTVNYLISERLYLRKTGKFDQADAIRDELMNKHSVRIRDKERVWRSGCSASGSGRNWSPSGRGGNYQGGGQRGRSRRTDFGPNGHDYNMSRGAGPIESPLSEQDIHAMLAERLQYKLNRDYGPADQIQAELVAAGVSINDKKKEWRADGTGFEDFTSRQYVQSQHSAVSDDDDDIQAMVQERSAAKLERNYQKADDIRDRLRDEFDVAIDDRRREWSVGGDFGVDQNRRDRFEPFSQAPGSASVEDTDEIQQLVEERDAARSNRDFQTADEIRDELKARNIFVDDRKRQWSVGREFGEEQRSTSYTRRGGGNLSEEDEELVNDLLAKRFEHKKNRKFKSADSIRDRLRDEFQIQIDDRSREWHVVTNEYAMSEGSASVDPSTKEHIEEMVSQRALAKLQKDYATADSIRDVLMQRYSVSLDDRVNEWTKLDASVNDHGDDGDFEIEDKEPGAMDELDNALDEMISNDTVEEEEDDSSDDEEDGGDGEEEPSSDVSSVDSASDLEQLTIPELKERLRASSLPVSGRKAELIERLMAS